MSRLTLQLSAHLSLPGGETFRGEHLTLRFAADDIAFGNTAQKERQQKEDARMRYLDGEWRSLRQTDLDVLVSIAPGTQDEESNLDYTLRKFVQNSRIQ